jgi:ligand-binding sensor domain-containing protein/anti-sigma regulatory factor (Ser/Thr protein kinase)
MARRIVFILVLMFVCVIAHAKITLPPYRLYTLRDGLPQMQIWSMLQDSRGHLWIGTKGGISRYDGEKFKNYSQVDGLADNRVDRIYEDYSGNIWIVTRFGISVFDGQKLTTYPLKHTDIHFAPTPDGKIYYYGTSDEPTPKAIFGYIENGKLTSLIEKYPLLTDIAAVQIVWSEQSKSFLISTGKIMYELQDQVLKPLIKDLVYPQIKQLGSTIAIYQWLNQTHLKIYNFRNHDIGLEAEVVDGCYVGDKRPRQMHTIKSGIGNSQVLWLKKDTIETINFPDKWINLSFIDSDNRLWIGSEEGLYKVYPGGFETYPRDALPMVWSLVEDKQQNMWFASLNLGLRKLVGDSLIHYPAESIAKYGSLFYYQAQVDERGTLYFPNFKGVLYYDGKSFGKISNGYCPASYYDKERKLLLVGSKQHMEAYDLQHRKVREVGPAEGVGIKGWFAAFGKDRKGNTWMGGGTGLVCYNWDTGKLSNYTRENGKLNCDGVSCVHQPPHGDIWFGGTQGLLWYDEKTDSIRQFQSPEAQDAVNLVSSIDSTWLLYSQPNGIYLLDLNKWRKDKTIELHLFNEQNGFIGLEPGQNGAAKDSKGNIWMTTGTEVVKLKPNELDFSNNRMNVRISGFNGKPVLFTQHEIILPKNDRTAVIQFETICFNRPKAARYSYRINEDGQEWSAWQDENYAVLTKLEDGKSEVQVRAMIPGIPGSETMCAIPVKVSIALWKQEWFFPSMLGLVSILVILSLALFLQTRTRLIQTNKQAKMFQLQAILSQLNPHFIFNVMASIQSEILSANIQKANEYLVKMSALIRGFLEASVSAGFSKSKHIKESELLLKKEIEILDHFIHFQQFIYPDRFDYELVLGSGIALEELTIPPMLIQPFVENSIKHGLLQKNGKGKLKINIYFSEKHILIIEIEDDGIGIERADALMRKSHLLYTSRGKELTLKRIKLLNEMGYLIQFRIDSSDSGTKVTLKINRNAE